MIKFQGRRIATGLEDTKEGRKIAMQLLERLYLESKGLAPVVEEESEGMRLDDAFDKFLEVHGSNKSKATKQNYTLAFKAIARTNYILSEAAVEADVLHYVRTAHKRGHNDTTINTYLKEFQTFLNFCSKRGWLPQTSFAAQHRKKTEVRVQVFEDWEIEKITAYFDKHDVELSILIQFQLQTGARVVDCLTLTWQQIVGDSILWVNKVTKKPEPRPVTPQAIELLHRLERKDDKVFRWQHISRVFLAKQLNRAMEACGIEKKGRGLQEMRVSFRNKLLDSGIPPEVAMKLMRHASLSTTLRHYTRITDEALKNALQKANLS